MNHKKNLNPTRERRGEHVFFPEKKGVSSVKYKPKKGNEKQADLVEKKRSNCKEKKSGPMNDDTEDEQNMSYHSANKILQEESLNVSRSDLSENALLEKQDSEYNETKQDVYLNKEDHPDTNAFSAPIHLKDKECHAHDENPSLLISGNFMQEQEVHIQGEPLELLLSTSYETHIPPFTQPSSSASTSPSIASAHSCLPSKQSYETQKTSQQPLSICETSTNILQKKFEEIYQHSSFDKTIDWEFFRLIVSDYDFVAKTHKEELSNIISAGIPSVLRGILWQTMTSSKNIDMEHIYHTLINQPTPNEKSIRRDLHRTFPKAMLKAMDQLYGVLKAYSLYDPEVGYTQGMAFLVGPLLLYMSDEEAFCVLVRLMKDYDLRSFYIPNMPGLHLRLYQFDRLMGEFLPEVHTYLHKQGVKPLMYASQWFMTFFAYKFPINIVVRIFDVIIAEGIEALLKFSIALIKKNKERILSLKFDQLLTFLKEKIFLVYSIPGKSITKLSWSTTASDYRIEEFINDAYSIEITKNILSKYATEYEEIKETEIEKNNEITFLRSQNSSLSLKIKNLEESLDVLNKEHIKLANTMIQNKMQIACLIDENEGLASEVSQLKLTIESQPIEIENRMKSEMQRIIDKNAQVMNKNRVLEDQMAEMENELVQTKIQLATIHDERDLLKKKWNELKKAIEN
ncbi:hypothetical protein PORY_001874 [Pneumocystis oryctolagi]|uniref:Uncharacterized protein n=1 Tax=Pneumocystis oryctolagi TaxID=42067 RepID=A0ACB7CB40_9ASCO|nr:hypothetical protein PORY_001874 [Pneumocystis oryctolagi]